ncbi:MAG TPA: YetF domain-containing protein [Candidatus Thermoplasmatota archaeon]|nr:YetF domain-containing protein [Candidatus Thermoplasmatota archaeon]
MDLVVRAAVVYLALFVIMRLSGNRQFSKMTTFDVVLVIVSAEGTGNALAGPDYSLTAAVVVIVTLVGLDIGLSLLKRVSRKFDKIAEGVPVLLVEGGRPLKENMRKERVDEEDVMAAARELQGLERMDQIKYAVLERSGKITIVPAGES